MMNPEQSEPSTRISRIRTLFRFEHQKLGLTLFLANAFWIFCYSLDVGTTAIGLNLGLNEAHPLGAPGASFMLGALLLSVTAGNFYMMYHKHMHAGRLSMISWGLFIIGMFLFSFFIHLIAAVGNLQQILCFLAH